ncbi:MAG: DUF58 domain-containing protein [Armatimonadetes bacterium]|nr:DUF58 domain-containing protein [Armatimonadota bacterium]
MAGKPPNGSDADAAPQAAGRRGISLSALRRLEVLRLRSRVAVEGHFSGQHRSTTHGASVEFADHREYAPGDDMRHLDWRLYARAERDFVKQFDAETNLCVYILLDVSASMAYPQSGPNKLDYGAQLAAGLAYVAWKQRDAPGLVLFDNRVRTLLPPRTQRGHLAHLLDVLDGLTPGEQTDFGGGLAEAAAAADRRGLTVLISDLWAAPETIIRSMRYFRRKGHDVLVLHVLHPDEIALPFAGSRRFLDPEGGRSIVADAILARRQYTQELAAHVTAIRDGLHAADVDYALCETSKPFDLALASVLAGRNGGP